MSTTLDATGNATLVVGKISSSCKHCGLPVPPPGPADDHSADFCCSGCQAAYSLIAGEGLEEYYALRERFSQRPEHAVDASLAEQSFVDLDSPRFTEQHTSASSEGRRQATLRLQGIHCAACVWLLERLPQLLSGVVDARVNLARSTIDLVWQPESVRLSDIARQVARLGYRVQPLVSSRRAHEQKALVRQQLIQIAIAGACSGNVMLLALAIYLGEWTGMAAEHVQLLRFACTAVGLVALLGPGSVFFRGAWYALKTGTPHMDLPVALGLGVGAASGVWNTLRGHGELYYDSLSMLVFLLLIGRALQSWQQRSACEAVDLLQQLTPGTARRVRDGAVEVVPIEEVVAGDTLEVRAGETLPVDGMVVMGASEIDASLLTGESLPQSVEVGQKVVAGTLNRTARLRIKAEQVGGQTRLGHLLNALEQAGIQKTPIVQWADRISGVFVTVVLCLAVLVGVTWYLIDSHVWSERVIAVLIVACPCALGLATPLAIAVALGRAARGGVLIKGGEPLQRLSRSGVLVLDKTGTLTVGALSIHQWHGDQQAAALAAAAEVDSLHPVAEAVHQYANHLKVDRLPAAQDVINHLGKGVSATVIGHKVVVGNRSLIREQGIVIDHDNEARLAAMAEKGQSPLLVAVDGRLKAIAAIGDRVRPEASQVLARLAKAGWEIHVLSGDHPRIVQQLASKLSLDLTHCMGGVSPEGKLERVREFQRGGRLVIMVGDGVNDAAALAAADVGIAVRGGAEASMQAADVYLANGSLEGIEEIMRSSRRTLKIIRRNSVASLFYNISSVSLAAIGWLHPLAAALLMPVSSLTVVAVTLWGQRDSRRAATTHEVSTGVEA